MYARVLRKWSLKTNLMSYLWLAVVTLLLLIICAPTTTNTMAMAATTRTPTSTTPPTVTIEKAQLQLAPNSRNSWRDLLAPAAAQASATIPATNVGVVEESFYIPVATSQEEGSSNSHPAWQQQQQHNVVRSRLINISSSSSSSSSSTSSRSSNSKILSNSRLYSNSFHKQQQQPAQHVVDDSLVYSYYYKAAASAASAAQQPATAVDDNVDDIDDTDLDVDVEEDEDDGDFEESEEHVADATASAAATLNNIFKIDKNKQVPNVPNSQIINLYNKFTQTQPAQQQQQQQQLIAANVHSTKARRHVLQEPKQHQQQLLQKAASFHSPVRETVTKAAVAAVAPVPSLAKNGSKSFTPPFRYIIEAFEIPATLPYTTLTQQQQRMLLHQQQLAARSRRDSRPFGLNAGNSGYQQHYYNSQLQQQQPYQRLQQQLQHHNANMNINNNNNNNNYNQKHHQTTNNNNNNHQHQQQHNHHHQQLHHNHYQQHQRNKRRRYCSARDPAQLAFEAPTVFEGKIISMTPDRRANFSATVEVKEIFKQQIGFRLQKYLRLQFAYRNTSGECDIYREQLRSRGLVRGDELEQGRIYLLFVQQIDLGNFTILGQPIRKTRRVIEAVKNAVSENYAQLAAIRSITASNRTVENGKELRIVCKVQGRPPPKVTWFKDHKSINRNRRLYQIVPFKKRSELIIRSFNSSDAGRYECRAKNKVNRNLERRAIVIKAYPVPRYETHLTGGTGHSCPPDAAEFCFNGGTCKLFVEIGSYSCICPEGFIGERCDRKEVNNMPPNPTYKTGYIADDPNAYDAELSGDADLDTNRTARFNHTAFNDDTDDDIDEDENESLEDD